MLLILFEFSFSCSEFIPHPFECPGDQPFWVNNFASYRFDSPTLVVPKYVSRILIQHNNEQFFGTVKLVHFEDNSQLVEIRGDFFFSKFPNLEEIKFYPLNVVYTGLFFRNTQLKTFTPIGYRSISGTCLISSQIVQLEDRCFSYTSFENLFFIPRSNQIIFGNYTFEYCLDLIHIFGWPNPIVPEGTFNCLASLVSFSFGSRRVERGVYLGDITKIGNYAFSGCFNPVHPLECVVPFDQSMLDINYSTNLLLDDAVHDQHWCSSSSFTLTPYPTDLNTPLPSPQPSTVSGSSKPLNFHVDAPDMTGADIGLIVSICVIVLFLVILLFAFHRTSCALRFSK